MGLDIRVGLEDLWMTGMWEQPRGMSISACRLVEYCRRTVEFHQRWEQGPAALLMLGQNGGGDTEWALGLVVVCDGGNSGTSFSAAFSDAVPPGAQP